MVVTDPISDMLTRIRNAYAVGKESTEVGTSKVKVAILSILKEKGYIKDYKEADGNITVTLSYDNDKPKASSLVRVSKPGRRVYVKSDEIPTVLSGEGITIVSTSKGIITGEEAKKNKLGGELIAKVY
ncbi:MAG: 30S ribosomal protein S8 [Patescibacteria group bacterium]|nr:30S ribosomal protein S8 [Patescibacteria group bacterium]